MNVSQFSIASQVYEFKSKFIMRPLRWVDKPDIEKQEKLNRLGDAGKTSTGEHDVQESTPSHRPYLYQNSPLAVLVTNAKKRKLSEYVEDLSHEVKSPPLQSFPVKNFRSIKRILDGDYSTAVSLDLDDFNSLRKNCPSN